MTGDAAFQAVCTDLDRLDDLGRHKLLAFLLCRPGMPAIVTDALTVMRNNGQLPAPVLTLHQGGRR